MPSCLAPSRSMPRRLWWLKKWVRNSTAMQSSFYEGMRQQQKFALRIERAALHAPGIPGRADLDPPVRRIDVHVGGHARDPAVGVEYRERQHGARGLQSQAAVDLLGHAFRCGHGRVPELPQLAVLHRFRQPVDMIVRQRFELRMRAAQRHRFKPGHFVFLFVLSLPATNAKRLRTGALATKQSGFRASGPMDYFASLAMTKGTFLYLFRKFSGRPGLAQSIAISSPLPDSVM